ncbi:hypothetical protein C7974DRAFT_29361 [Boeremia exigua]|uniref:uncharacterized protein n=1 Tax=Boeremia exigua TaxID=749465 RepID=UPI001E8DED35|nr:uncharacterized protein C7974DRAFT_29361 [Boeremia exigua]KAH6644871.1 hypothetical protein C7974DRAFT_29361 [Boeremia exigua]
MNYAHVTTLPFLLDSSHLTPEELAERNSNPALFAARRYGQPEHIFREAAERHENGSLQGGSLRGPLRDSSLRRCSPRGHAPPARRPPLTTQVLVLQLQRPTSRPSSRSPVLPVQRREIYGPADRMPRVQNKATRGRSAVDVMKVAKIQSGDINLGVLVMSGGDHVSQLTYFM